MRRRTAGLVSVSAVLVAGLIGAQSGPQNPRTALWYSWLRKSDVTPPGPVFGGAWSLLEVLLAATGYRLLKATSSSGRRNALAAWTGVLVGLAAYPWLLFGRKRLGISTLAAGAMFAGATGLVAAARKVDPPAATMTIPLVLWPGFATFLSEELWRKNPSLSRVHLAQF